MIVLRVLNRLLVELAALLLSAWHRVSPAFGNHCRFHPTCSQYALEAMRRKGFLPGIVLAARRVLRCNSLSPGGYDPVLKR